MNSATGATPLAASGCPPRDLGCVTVLKNIKTIELLHERETLSVELDRAKLDDFVEAKAHRTRAFRAQYIASWIVLALVITIVGAGLAMSWKQLVHGLRTGVLTDSHAEIGANGVKIQSAVIGLVIFLASIGFFSIYIDKVYTITILKEMAEPRAEAPLPSS